MATMTSYFWRRGVLAAVVTLAGLLTVGHALDLDSQVAKKVRYPAYDAKGQIQYEVFGDEARVLPDGRIHVINLKLLLYEDGRKATEITSPECFLDRARQIALSTSAVCLVRAEMKLTGVGYEVTWTNQAGHVTLHDQVRLVLSHGANP